MLLNNSLHLIIVYLSVEISYIRKILEYYHVNPFNLKGYIYIYFFFLRKGDHMSFKLSYNDVVGLVFDACALKPPSLC